MFIYVLPSDFLKLITLLSQQPACFFQLAVKLHYMPAEFCTRELPYM